jgi:hypothetical protein
MAQYSGFQMEEPQVEVPASPIKPRPGSSKYSSKYQLKGNPITSGRPKVQSTDEEEFDAYKCGALSPPDTDLVQFWQVRSWFSSHLT